MMCRHCQVKKINRPRGLCWRCYYTPGVIDRYPMVNVYNNCRGSRPDFNGRSGVPEPTDALPLSEEKMQVMVERARLGQELWHPLDGISTRGLRGVGGG